MNFQNSGWINTVLSNLKPASAAASHALRFAKSTLIATWAAFTKPLSIGGSIWRQLTERVVSCHLQLSATARNDLLRWGGVCYLIECGLCAGLTTRI